MWQRLPPDGRQRSRTAGRPGGGFVPLPPLLVGNWPSSFSSSVSEKVARGESFAEAAARGLEEELGIRRGGGGGGGNEGAVLAEVEEETAAGEEGAAAARGGRGEAAAGAEASSSSASSSAFSYPGLPCSYETRLFAAEVDESLLPSEEFFEREEETARGTLVTRWQWVKRK